MLDRKTISTLYQPIQRNFVFTEELSLFKRRHGFGSMAFYRLLLTFQTKLLQDKKILKTREPSGSSFFDAREVVFFVRVTVCAFSKLQKNDTEMRDTSSEVPVHTLGGQPTPRHPAMVGRMSLFRSCCLQGCERR